MTEISEAEAAEVLWASSEQGKAAVRAARDKARQLLVGTKDNTPASLAEIGAIVYAAYLAAGWDSEPVEDDDDDTVPTHLHTWAILGAQEAPITGIVFGKPMPKTVVLATCTDCGEPYSWLVNGTWTLEDLRRQ